MKSYKIIASALLLTAGMSCKKGNDLQVNPNSPGKPQTPQTMLTAVEAGTFMNYEGGLSRIASIFVQYNSGVSGQATTDDNYVLDPSDMDNYWNGIYQVTMMNSKIMFTSYEASYPYYGGMARILMAFNLGIATDMWGDVPYSQALQLQSGIASPIYDPQQAIFTDIQSLLTQGINDLNKATTANLILPGADDVIFGGNTSAWIKMAYTLKARYYMRGSKRYGSTAAADSVLANLLNGMTANTDDAKSSHLTTNDENQWCAFQQSRGQYILACKTLIDSLGGGGATGDPRAWMYFDTTNQGNIVVGSVVGAENISVSQWGPYLVNGACNIPTPLVTAAEAMFLAAEANVRLGNAAAANTALVNAIQLSIQDVTSGAASGTAQSAVYTPANTTLHNVMLEKWKAMFGQPIEAYSDYRRTGYPVLVPNPTANVNYIPKRMLTPLGEQTYNHNAPIIQLNVPEWFAQ